MSADDLQQFLKQQHLIYVYEEPPGIRRLKKGKGFSFLDVTGKTIRCAKERQRLLSVAVPPTYKKVWYCPRPNGHLQATGFDSNDKKQYFYHTSWAALRETRKYDRMCQFGANLPRFRRKVSSLLKDDVDNKDTVLAAMARILDKTGMRVGSALATDLNKTYGLTTLRKKHLHRENDDEIYFEYKGKAGVDLETHLKDPDLIRVIDECADIPGQKLFQYRGEDGHVHAIGSQDMNEFIKTHMEGSFSAKDFRTWRFNCLFIEAILKHADQNPTLKSLLETVCETSGNTPSILQSSYLHPGLIQLAKDKDWGHLDRDTPDVRGLQKTETILLAYLNCPHAGKHFAP
jgi:DNA topoisomerase-1